MPLATADEPVITGKGFEVSGWTFQTNEPVFASIASSHPVGPDSGCDHFWIPVEASTAVTFPPQSGK